MIGYDVTGGERIKETRHRATKRNDVITNYSAWSTVTKDEPLLKIETENKTLHSFILQYKFVFMPTFVQDFGAFVQCGVGVRLNDCELLRLT